MAWYAFVARLLTANTQAAGYPIPGRRQSGPGRGAGFPSRLETGGIAGLGGSFCYS